MFDKTMSIDGFDPELAAAIGAEAGRQEEHIELIASENYASPRVLAAQGSVLTNKYADAAGYRCVVAGCVGVLRGGRAVSAWSPWQLANSLLVNCVRGWSCLSGRKHVFQCVECIPAAGSITPAQTCAALSGKRCT